MPFLAFALKPPQDQRCDIKLTIATPVTEADGSYDDLNDEDIVIFEVSDQALEAAAGTGRGG
jgi:hypothetical protein